MWINLADEDRPDNGPRRLIESSDPLKETLILKGELFLITTTQFYSLLVIPIRFFPQREKYKESGRVWKR